MTILAWHNDPALKADAVARMRQHKEADEFLRGSYIFSPADVQEILDDGNPRRLGGCFHGCLTAEKLAEEQAVPPWLVDSRGGIVARDYPNSWHGQGERLWGIPADLGAELDRLFENWLDTDDAAGQWAVAVTEAIPVGADLSGVCEAFEVQRDGHADEPALMVALLVAAPVVAPDA